MNYGISFLFLLSEGWLPKEEKTPLCILRDNKYDENLRDNRMIRVVVEYAITAGPY